MFATSPLVPEPSVESVVLRKVKRTSFERTGWPSCHFARGLMWNAMLSESATPRPAISEARSEAGVVHDVERIADVGEPIVNEVHNLPCLNGREKRGNKDVRIAANRIDESAAGGFAGRRFGPHARAQQGDAKESCPLHRRHVQPSSRKCGMWLIVSPRISSSANSVASSSSSDRTASNIALATSATSGERPNSA